jgi:hypothetical protein
MVHFDVPCGGGAGCVVAAAAGGVGGVVCVHVCVCVCVCFPCFAGFNLLIFHLFINKVILLGLVFFF